MSEPLVLVEQRERVTTLTLNNPARRNPLSSEMMEELLDALRFLPEDSAAVVLAAAGPVFSAGHDLAEVRDGDEAELGEDLRPLHRHDGNRRRAFLSR